MIEFKNVNKVYDGSFPALEDLTLQINDREFVFVVGPSESGKSSIFRLLTRMEKPTAGSLVVSGVDIGAMKRRKVPYYRRKLGIIFQDPRLFPKRTVLENIALALRVVGESSADVRMKSLTALKMVELADVSQKTPGQLSAFDQQRVALARALAGGAGIIVADEPTGNLNPVQAKEFIELLMRIHSRYGKTVLIFTNGKEFAEEFGQRIIFLSHGVVEEDRAAVRPLIAESDEEESIDEDSQLESESEMISDESSDDESITVYTPADSDESQTAESDTVQFDALALEKGDTVQFNALALEKEDTVQFNALALEKENTVQFNALALEKEDTVQFNALALEKENTVQFDALALEKEDAVQFDAPALEKENTVQFDALFASDETEETTRDDTLVNLPILSILTGPAKEPEAVVDELKESETVSEEIADAESAAVVEENSPAPATEVSERQKAIDAVEAFVHTTTFDTAQISDSDLLDAVMKILGPIGQSPVEEVHHRAFNDITVSDDWNGHAQADVADGAAEQVAEEDVQ